jgi:hypothetical protein
MISHRLFTVMNEISYQSITGIFGYIHLTGKGETRHSTVSVKVF